MKYLTVALISNLLVSLPASLMAQSAHERELKQLKDDRDRALGAASEPINRRYKASLEQLLRRAMQNNDLEAAIKIREALQGLGATPTNAAIADPTGKWAWTSGRTISIQADGKFTVDLGGGGKWRWTSPAKGEFTMIWDRGDYVDTLVITSDSKKITGSNNKGDRVNVSRVK